MTPLPATTTVAATLLATLLVWSPPVLADTLIRTSSFEYNAAGLLTREVIEPDSPNDCLQTSYTYSALGYLKTVTGGGTAGYAQTVSYTVLAMNAQGQVTQYRTGNNVTTVKTHEAATNRLLGQSCQRRLNIEPKQHPSSSIAFRNLPQINHSGFWGRLI